MIKTIFCFAYVVAAVILLTPLGIVVVVFSLLGLRKPMSCLMYRAAQGWALLMIKLTGCQMSVSGRENIPAAEGICFVSNHGSIFDIVLLLAYAGRPIGFVAKKELLLIPLLNMWISVLGGLFIDRKNVRNAIKTINTGVRRVKSGSAMIIFPEGHRSRGQGLLPFHPGSLKLATQAEARIVPVALKGTYEAFEKNYRVERVKVSVSFGKPICTADIPPTDRKLILSDRIYAVIRDMLGAT
jgi:1-acyl-sn-glycerol-3-phosphate acyltransferase